MRHWTESLIAQIMAFGRGEVIIWTNVYFLPIVSRSTKFLARKYIRNVVFKISAILSWSQYAAIPWNTETKMSSFWRNLRHCPHWKLSKWQLPVQSMTKISSKWWQFCSVLLSVCHRSFVWRIYLPIGLVVQMDQLCRTWMISSVWSSNSLLNYFDSAIGNVTHNWTANESLQPRSYMLQLNWRSDTRRFHLLVPDLQTSSNG